LARRARDLSRTLTFDQMVRTSARGITLCALGLSLRKKNCHMGLYTEFKILLDTPAEDPGLGFAGYASALAEIVAHSRAEFAVGIFGSWGSGKTTLMRAIEKRLAEDPSVVTVWFTAWRYEKEPHLIVPLIDVLREALNERAGGNPGWARDAAGAVAHAGRLFLEGLTLTAGVPGINAAVEPAKWFAKRKADQDSEKPISFFQAGFVMLRQAIHDLSEGGRRRVVIFVDDLDRCLLPNVLVVLESIKLFFDVEGCVFVVGLDPAIAERSVADKYRTLSDSDPQTAVSGTDYVKKIFQVPFTLPPVSTRQLHEYVSLITKTSDLRDAQREDFRKNVQRHLRYLPTEDSVNPREIKRLINAYILQLKMLSELHGSALLPDVVLALQVMSFRPDWSDLYAYLAADPRLFQIELKEAVRAPQPPETVWLSSVKQPLPAGLVQYLRTDAADVLEVDDLQSYVSAAESTRSTDPSLLEAQTMVNGLRRTTDQLTSGGLSIAAAGHKILEDVKRLSSTTSRRSRLDYLMENTISQLNYVAQELASADSAAPDDFAQTWAAKATPLFDALDARLRELNRYVNVGAYA